MDMGDMGMDMGGMDMGNGTPSLFSLQRMYWAVVGAVIAFATLTNVLEKVQRWQRLRSKCARPRSWFWTAHATTTAICREIYSAPTGSLTIKTTRVSLPPLGRFIIVLSNLVVVLTFCFYKLNTTDQWSWEDVGYRTGFIAICQLPLVFLLAGKENIIGALTGLGYERLNWLHRWIARTLWLNVTIHMGFWFRSWGRYDYISSKIAQDPITQRGLAAWAILTFIVLTSWMPVRRLNYEIFVITHLVTFSGFIGAVWIHVPNEVKVWVWIPIGLFFFDRLMRMRRVAWVNVTILHPSQRRKGTIQQGVWANKATLEPLPGNITKITISKPAISWKPGQHVFLACHSVVPLQSHPFTIATLPSDGKMEFYVKAEKGGTKRFRNYASKISHLPLTQPSSQVSTTKHVSIEGPYGRSRPLDQFDSTVFFAGSTGANYTLPQMRDIVYRWSEGVKLPFGTGKAKPVTRRIRFVWVIKSRDQFTWFREQLKQVMRDTGALRAADPDFDVDIEISVYVTCDEDLMAPRKNVLPFPGRTSSPFPSSQPKTHGEPQEISSAEKESDLYAEKPKDALTEVRSTASDSASSASPANSKDEALQGADDGCGQPDGTCCCRATVVEDEDKEPVVCTCGAVASRPSSVKAKSTVVNEKSSPSPSSFSSSSSSQESSKEESATDLKLLSGRPHPEFIIRKVLEEAQGETAVVVCGPKGLRDDVRATTVRLCDERAVCKGTGAFGVWLRVEGFEY